MKEKLVHIVRHGKALQDYQLIGDDDRPLTEKGIINNISVIKKFIAQYPLPDLIYSSYASRAIHTAHIFAREMGYPHDKVHANEELYLHGDKETYIILESLSDDINSVMIIGHNPDMTYVVNRFGAQINEIRTSGIVTICFETTHWSEIDRVSSKCSSLDK